LPHPPSYEYQSSGPWFVCQMYGGAQAWITLTLESAILRFWLRESEVTGRRVIVDSYGVVILGTVDGTGFPMMVGTRQTMEETLRFVCNTNGMELEEQAAVVAMAEGLRAVDGNASW